MKKKIVFVIILAAFLSAVYANGSAKDVPVTDIESRLTAETAMKDMAKGSDRSLMQFLGLDCQQFDSYIYYKGTEALSVDEVLIIKGHPNQDMSAVKDAVDSRIESQIKTYEGYGPKQVALLKNAIIVTKGDFLFYSVGEAAEKCKEVFEDAI